MQGSGLGETESTPKLFSALECPSPSLPISQTFHASITNEHVVFLMFP